MSKGREEENMMKGHEGRIEREEKSKGESRKDEIWKENMEEWKRYKLKKRGTK